MVTAGHATRKGRAKAGEQSMKETLAKQTQALSVTPPCASVPCLIAVLLSSMMGFSLIYPYAALHLRLGFWHHICPDWRWEGNTHIYLPWGSAAGSQGVCSTSGKKMCACSTELSTYAPERGPDSSCFCAGTWESGEALGLGPLYVLGITQNYAVWAICTQDAREWSCH